MELENIFDKTFDKKDFTTGILGKAEYERCIFNNCNFSNVNLDGFEFLECIFNGCDLSMAKLAKTAWRDVDFRNCKMLGFRFDQCNTFNLTFSLDGCIVNYASFYQLKLKKLVFKNSQMHQVDFTDCDLSGVVFDECDLADAKFENSVLEKTDFRSAFNYSIDPSLNKVKKARFSLLGLPGLLEKYDIDITR